MDISLVVGGTKGIGLVIADNLRERGDKVYTISRSRFNEKKHFSIDLSKVDELEAKLDSYVADVNGVQNLVFSQRYRGIDDFNSECNVMLSSTKKIIETLTPHFSDSASIVIIGSPLGKFIAAVQSQFGMSYHITRAALEQLVKYCAVNLGPKGVRVNCIMPGNVLKPENQDFFRKNVEKRKQIESIIPLRRMGASENVADLVRFLCSDQASFITGQSIHVDGGVTLLFPESLFQKKGVEA